VREHAVTSVARRRPTAGHAGGGPGGPGEAVTVPGGYWPHPEIAPRTELLALDVASLSWHLLYLVGIGGFSAAVAVARHHRTRALRVAALAAAGLTATGGLLQLR
jgi:hypothetical protein